MRVSANAGAEASPTSSASTTSKSAGVQVAAENAFSKPDSGEDQADFAPRNHPEPDEAFIAWCALPAPTAATSLPTTATARRAPAIPIFRFDERLDPGLDTDLEEEDRDEEVTDGSELALDPFRRGEFPGERGTGHERADYGRQFGGVGELRKSECERECERNQRSRRAG